MLSIQLWHPQSPLLELIRFPLAQENTPVVNLTRKLTPWHHLSPPKKPPPSLQLLLPPPPHKVWIQINPSQSILWHLIKARSELPSHPKNRKISGLQSTNTVLRMANLHPCTLQPNSRATVILLVQLPAHLGASMLLHDSSNPQRPQQPNPRPPTKHLRLTFTLVPPVLLPLQTQPSQQGLPIQERKSSSQAGRNTHDPPPLRLLQEVLLTMILTEILNRFRLDPCPQRLLSRFRNLAYRERRLSPPFLFRSPPTTTSLSVFQLQLHRHEVFLIPLPPSRRVLSHRPK
jgi:hypothetical protein